MVKQENRDNTFLCNAVARKKAIKSLTHPQSSLSVELNILTRDVCCERGNVGGYPCFITFPQSTLAPVRDSETAGTRQIKRFVLWLKVKLYKVCL